MSVDQIQKEIQKQKADWQAKDHKFLKMSDDKFKRRLGANVTEEVLRRTRSRPRPDLVRFIAESKGLEASDIYSEKSIETIQNFIAILSDKVDWRNHNDNNFVTPIRDQGDCASCVSFGTLATFESMLLIEHEIELDLSEAELFFCGGGNCEYGWWPDLGDGTGSIPYLKANGISRETCFPYADYMMPCRTCDNRKPIWFANDIVIWDINQRKQYLSNVGPMICVFDVYHDLQFYAGGVYSNVSGKILGSHCVEVIGYEQVPGCWICKNSWGNDWGDNGFFRIKYGECGIDSRYPFWGIAGTFISPLPTDLQKYKEWKKLFKSEMVTQLIDDLIKLREKIGSSS